MASESEGVGYFHFGHASFLLQNFYEKSLAENLVMHLLVEDVEAWRNHIDHSGIAINYKSGSRRSSCNRGGCEISA
jgi:hypothetical protein